MAKKKRPFDPEAYMSEPDDPEEEARIIEAIEKGLLKPLPRKEFLREKAMLQAAARNYFKRKQAKDGRVTIRVPLPVIDALKNFACEDGLPYQTLINSLLYKYVVSRSQHNT